MRYVYLAKGIKTAEGIKAANQPTLRWEIFLNGPRGIRVITGTRQNHEDGSLRLSPTLLALKMAKVAMSGEFRWLPGAGKAKKRISPWSLRKGPQSCWHLDVSPGRPTSDF